MNMHQTPTYQQDSPFSPLISCQLQLSLFPFSFPLQACEDSSLSAGGGGAGNYNSSSSYSSGGYQGRGRDDDVKLDDDFNDVQDRCEKRTWKYEAGFY